MLKVASSAPGLSGNGRGVGLRKAGRGHAITETYVMTAERVRGTAGGQRGRPMARVGSRLAGAPAVDPDLVHENHVMN